MSLEDLIPQVRSALKANSEAKEMLKPFADAGWHIVASSTAELTVSKEPLVWVSVRAMPGNKRLRLTAYPGGADREIESPIEAIEFARALKDSLRGS